MQFPLLLLEGTKYFYYNNIQQNENENGDLCFEHFKIYITSKSLVKHKYKVNMLEPKIAPPLTFGSNGLYGINH